VLVVASRLDAATTTTFSAAIAEISTRYDDRVLTTPVVCQSVDPVVESNFDDVLYSASSVTDLPVTIEHRFDGTDICISYTPLSAAGLTTAVAHKLNRR